jgi:hypothetical protein
LEPEEHFDAETFYFFEMKSGSRIKSLEYRCVVNGVGQLFHTVDFMW